MRQWRFNWLAGLVVGWLVFGSGGSLRASDGGATGILEITFENGTSSVDTLPAWAREVSFDGGALGSRDGRNVWTVDSSRPVGEGRVDIWLHRAELPDALAVVVAFDPLESTDLAIQLYDAQNQVVAVDLFGNLAETREIGGSDTFVIPMRKYPTAARVTIRRIAGPLVLSGLAAFPVIEELNALSQSEEAAFERLLARGAASVAGETGSDAGDRGFRIRRERELAISNTIADKVLGAPGYPRARWASGTVLEAPFSLYVSGTAYRFVTNILMQMYPDSNQLGDELFFTSSASANTGLATGRTQVAVVSKLPSGSELRDFKSRTGFAPMVIPIALDAIEVIAHPANMLDAVSYQDLRSLFGPSQGEDLDWTAFPAASLSGPVVAVGGNPAWGTSRSFAEVVGLTNGFTLTLISKDIAFPHGVEKSVSEDPRAIGFAQYRPRKHAVKSLNIIPAAGRAPVGVSADTVYGGTYPLTRYLYLILAWENSGDVPANVRSMVDLLLSYEGQTEVALVGNFPLESSEVLRARRDFGF